MFVVIYRWRLRAGREEEFERAWARMTMLIRQECGSEGSALWRSDDGVYVGIARWPDRESRERCTAVDAIALGVMKDCTQERHAEECLTVVNNLWAPER